MLLYLLYLDIERQKALDILDRRRYVGELTPDAVYYLVLRAYQDIDKAEEARANAILQQSRKND